MTSLFVLFVILPLLSAIVLFFVNGRHHWQQWLSLASVSALWLFSLYALVYVFHHGIVVLKMGNWRAPFGIILVADILSLTMVALTMTIALAVILFSLPTIDREREEHFYYPLFFSSAHGH